MMRRVPALSAFATTAFISHGARNWPFLMLIAHRVFAAASMRSVWRESNAGIWITSTTFAAGGAFWGLLVLVGTSSSASAFFALWVFCALTHPLPPYVFLLFCLRLSVE